MYDVDRDGEVDLIEKTAFTYEVYRGRVGLDFEWIQSIAEPPGWLAFANVDGSPGAELLGLRASPNRLVVVPNVTSPAAQAPVWLGAGRQTIALRPTVSSGGAIKVRLDRDFRLVPGSVVARVIDAGGATRARVELASAPGGGHEGEIPIAESWATGVYWVQIPGSGIEGRRFTLVR